MRVHFLSGWPTHARCLQLCWHWRGCHHVLFEVYL